MKRLFILASAVALAAACAREDVPAESAVTFSASLPSAFTKSVGDGLTASNLVYAVYDGEGAYLSEGKSTLSGGKATVSMNLVNGKSYSILFWAFADGSPYTFDTAKKTVTVSYDGASANDEKRDAFYARKDVTVSGSVNETVTLTRPFAQLNVATSDYEQAVAAGVTLSKSGLTLSKAYTTFNLYSGAAGDAVENVTFALADLPAETLTLDGTSYKWLSMNYILAADTKETADKVSVSFNDGDVSLTYSSIPLSRNWRTNIYGSLLTASGTFNVNVAPGTGGDHDANQDPEPVSQIASMDDWKTFAAQIASGYDYNGKTVTLTADITASSSFTYADGTFDGTFDGNGKTLTANGNSHPLFAAIGAAGVVKNLTTAGAFTSMDDPSGTGNAFLAKVNLGTISDCTNNASTELTTTSATIFGALVAQNGGLMKNCKNYGNVTISHNASASAAFYGGGLCAIGHTVSASGDTATDDTCKPGSFVGCENHGNIVAKAINASAATVQNGIGGICGMVYLNGVSFDGCKNTGAVSRISDGEKSSNYASAVGGILGRSAGYTPVTGGFSVATFDVGSNAGFNTVLKGCTNEGAVLNQCRHSGGMSAIISGARTDCTGGIVGAVIGKGDNIAKITGCSSTGSVKGGWSSVNTAVLGGIAGVACVADISGCTAVCALESVDESHPVGAAGGMAGYSLGDVNISGSCVAKPAINVYQASSKSLFYGLAFGAVKGSTTSSISDTAVAGSITVDGTALADITADNYADNLVSSSSTGTLTTSNVTFYSE